jgi:hypothetical protein
MLQYKDYIFVDKHMGLVGGCTLVETTTVKFVNFHLNFCVCPLNIGSTVQ